MGLMPFPLQCLWEAVTHEAVPMILPSPSSLPPLRTWGLIQPLFCPLEGRIAPSALSPPLVFLVHPQTLSRLCVRLTVLSNPLAPPELFSSHLQMTLVRLGGDC